MSTDEPLIIDCDQCDARPSACSDCVVGVLLGAPRPVEWDETERRAVTMLADAGMVPRLRLVSVRRNDVTVRDRQAS